MGRVWNGDIAGGRNSCSRCSQLFPVFPVLFPVCSQISANAFNVFPMFCVPEACAINAVFCIPFSQPENTGNNEN